MLEAAPIGGNPALARLPADYTGFRYTTTVDKESNNQVRDIYANEAAVISANNTKLARGSVLVMEIYSALLDASEQPKLGADGRYLRGDLQIIAVMEKAEGYGNYTEETKNGEWEYAFYTPDGAALENEADCYGCHKDNAGPDSDYIFSLAELRAAPELPMAPIGGNAALLTFPGDYRSFTYTTTVDKESNNQVRDIYANETAVLSAGKDGLDRGSILVMEIYGAQLDANEAPMLDAAGRYIRGDLNIVAVMEKREGFGQYNPMNRNGEWEYAFFTPDGAPIDNEADCYGCHNENAGPQADYIFSLDQLRTPEMLPDAPLGGNHGLVEYPQDYSNFQMYTSVDKASNNQVRDLFANDVAMASPAGTLDRGSILVMEIYGAELDMNGMPVMGPDARFVRSDLNIIAVMEKKLGFGKYSASTRNGEWEYAFFNPDGSALPSEADCYGCHNENAGPSTDFVFSLDALQAAR